MRPIRHKAIETTFSNKNVIVTDSNYLLACVRDDTIQLIDLRMNTIVRSFR